MYIEVAKGVVRWFYRVRADNGQILLTSQKYYSKSNAKRAARKAALGLKIKER